MLIPSSKRLREITNYGIKHAQSPHASVISVMAKYEELIDRYKVDFSNEEPVFGHQKRDVLKQVMPREVERAWNLNNLGRVDDVSYDDMKEAIEEFMLEHGAPERVSPRRANVAAADDVLGLEGGKGAFLGKGAQQPPQLMG